MILKCKMCGAQLDIDNEQDFCVCRYCGTKHEIEKPASASKPYPDYASKAAQNYVRPAGKTPNPYRSIPMYQEPEKPQNQAQQIPQYSQSKQSGKAAKIIIAAAIVLIILLLVVKLVANAQTLTQGASPEPAVISDTAASYSICVSEG